MSIVLLVFVSGIITLAFSPQMLFANKMEHNKFTVYSNEHYDVESMKIRMDEAYKLVERSELHNPDLHYGILLAHNHYWNQLEDLRGKGAIARPLVNNITIKIPVVPEYNIANSERSVVNLTVLLAHEMIHVLQADKYGLWNFGLVTEPPMWKLEGYPEYIARRDHLEREGYNLRKEIDRYIKLEKESKDGWIEVFDQHNMPSIYYKGRLMVEYLMDVQGMTYDQILNDLRTEEEIFDELLQWKNYE